MSTESLRGSEMETTTKQGALDRLIALSLRHRGLVVGFAALLLARRRPLLAGVLAGVTTVFRLDLGAAILVGVALLAGGGALFFLSRGRTQVANIRMLPKTTETLRENMEWMRSRSSRT